MSTKLLQVKQYCQQHSVKLTPLREQILALILLESRPITAYALLDELKKSNPKAQVMSVYRVLDFLLESGLIHRIESLNAFIACCHLSHSHISQWLICERCGVTTEYASAPFSEGISAVEQQTGFLVSNSMIELLGLCVQCQR